MRTNPEKSEVSLRQLHRRSLALALAALALCFFAPHEADGQWFLFGRAQNRYDRCIELYSSNQFDEARMCIRTFLSEYPNSRWVEQLQFLEAKLETNVYEAQAKMRRFLQEFPEGPYSAEANFSLGELYELTADYASARKFYLQVYRYFLTSELRDEAGVRAAKCMLLDGDTMSAKKYLQDYLAANPSPPWRSRARELYADTLLESGEFATAQKMYKEIISEAPRRPRQTATSKSQASTRATAITNRRSRPIANSSIFSRTRSTSRRSSARSPTWPRCSKSTFQSTAGLTSSRRASSFPSKGPEGWLAG